MKENKGNILVWLTNPFHFLGGQKLLAIGIAVLLLHIPIGYLFGARFDGAIDMHITGDVSMLQVFVDVLIAWLSLAISFYLSATLFKAPIRFVDIAGATALARVPLLLSVIPGFIFAPEAESLEEILAIEGSELCLLVAGSLVILGLMIWFFIVLFNAYKINSNLKGWKLGVGFVAGVIAAEGVSLFLIRELFAQIV